MSMPNKHEVSLPPMRNNAIGEDEYNREVHAFVEELMALQRKYNMAYGVNIMGRAFVTRNIIPVKAISYNLEN